MQGGSLTIRNPAGRALLPGPALKEAQNKRWRIDPELPWIQVLQRLGSVQIHVLRGQVANKSHLDPVLPRKAVSCPPSLSACHAGNSWHTNDRLICTANSSGSSGAGWVQAAEQPGGISTTPLRGTSCSPHRPCAEMQQL